ncbi:single-stranded DNA-binding protein [Clostridia bacterium]|nr:single-stranded DNA-binding protein [Clostridia bacterium]
MYNRIILTGNLITNPEERIGNDKKKRAIYKLEVKRMYHREGDPESDTFRIISSSKQAENDLKYLTEHALVIVEGRLEFTNEYPNVLADNVRYIANGQQK